MNEPFRFVDPRQERIHRRLALVGPGPSSFFRDACRLMTGALGLESTTHLVAHLLREIESALRDVLETIADRHDRLQQKGREAHKEEIRSILRALSIPENDPIARAWLDVASRGEGLPKLAHRDALDRPRPNDDDFQHFWEKIQQILDAVLERFESRYLEYHAVIDALVQKAVPDAEDLRLLSGHLPNNLIARGDFFNRLTYPGWLDPLNTAGFFRDPPNVVRDETKSTVSFPPWPECRYLARMAKLPEAQAKVVEIALRIETDNVSIHEDLADVALALPVEMAARFVSKAKKWLESPYEFLLPEKLGALVEHLARGGAVDEALDLAAALLAVLPDQRPLPETDLPEEMRLPREPVARFNVWLYEQILKKHVAPLVDAAGERAFALFCDLLEQALRLSRPEPQEQPVDGEVWDDSSWSWRPAVEEHAQNRRETVKALLVGAVRDAAELLAGQAPESVPELVRRLEARRWLIFRRVALHLLSLYPDPAMALVEERFTNRALFDAWRLRHEYVLLAAAAFARVSEAARQKFLGWIDQEPDLAAYRTRYRAETGKDLTEEEAVRLVKMWRRDRLAPLNNVLPADWQRRYEELVAELGEPAHPEFAVYVEAGYVGATSPKSADELRTMAVAEIVDFLKGWTPPTDWFGPSKEGLGRELTSVVGADAQRFAQEARLFTGVHPTYVRALVEGWTDAAKKGRAFDWAPVLDLCEWVVQQPREIQGTPGRVFEEDPGWGWTRGAIADLLSAGFAAGAAELRFTLREQAWRVLRVLTDDPEPTPAFEAQYGGGNMDPATMSLGTTRGKAMHAVVQYALWVRRHIEQLPDGPARVAAGLAAMPEVREVLEAHIDPQNDPSLAIRAVYGQWFPWLVLLDRTWAASQLARIFPTDDPERRDVAWETYVVFCPPYDNVFEVLEGEYAKTIERLGTGAAGGRRHLADPEERLAEHLMLLYEGGKLAWESQTGLLGRFFKKAPGQVRGRAIEFIGRRLRDNNKGDIPATVIQRFTALWEHRMECARGAPADSVEELANFGWWVASQKFDEAWALRQLEEALRLGKKLELHCMSAVAETLASIAARRPREAVRCLEGLVEADRDGWGILGSKDHIRTTLAVVIRTGDVEACQIATDLVHRLGARGYLEFRDLLA